MLNEYVAQAIIKEKMKEMEKYYKKPFNDEVLLEQRPSFFKRFVTGASIQKDCQACCC